MASPMAIPAAATVLWVSSLLNTANRSAVIKEALSITGLWVFSFRHEILASVTPLFGTVFISTTLAVFAGLTYISFRGPRLLEASRLGGARLQSEPVFFRCRTHHTRFFPKKHSFAYSVLEAGIPLSFQGSIGRLFSFNNGYNDTRANDKRWSLFCVDSRDYLRRGDETLEEKMRAFLKENDMNFEDYPTVYLVTAPRFLGYQFNPASFWYLKDKNSVLSLVVVEVNNTFDERHMYILRPSSHSASSAAFSDEKSNASILNSFPKTFHVSPFNDRTGRYHVLAHDPLSARGSPRGLVDTVITLYDDAENKKLVAALRSVAPPIFMSDLSSSIIASSLFVMRYGWSGLITFPRIVWEASKLFGVKKLKVSFRPEVKGTTISRNATALEMQLERYFRQYLKSRVRDYPHLIIVHYCAAGIGSLPHKEVFQSVLASKSTPAVALAKEINITIFSPSFYITWAASQTTRQTLVSEMLLKLEEKRSIEVSNLELVVSLLDGSDGVVKDNGERHLGQKTIWHLIGVMRGWICSRQEIEAKTTKPLTPYLNSPSEIDRQILLLPDVDSRVYRKCIMQALLTETIGHRDEMLLRGLDLVIRAALVYFVWQGFAGAGTLKPWVAVGGLAVWRMLKDVV